MLYLTCIGFYLLYKAFTYPSEPKIKKAKIAVPLGLIGGFPRCLGRRWMGSGGDIQPADLQGTDPRKTVGTVNTAEFFLTTSISITFILTIGLEAFTIVTGGLLIGGLVAAPLGRSYRQTRPTENVAADGRHGVDRNQPVQPVQSAGLTATAQGLHLQSKRRI